MVGESTIDDAERVRRAAAGDVSAYAALVERYRNLVFGVAYHRLQNFEDARDVAQESFIHAFVHLRQLREAGRFGPWLRQIVVNECRAYTRGYRPTVEIGEDEPSREDAIRRADDRIVIQQALTRLGEPARLTVTLFYLRSYSMQEIAEFLDEPVTTIKSRLRNARTRLRKELQDMLEDSLPSEALPASFADQVTAVIEAAGAGDAERLATLLRSDPRLAHARNLGKTTPLHVAATGGHLAVVDLLLANGADPNAHDESDNASPLHYAAERGHLEVVRHLVTAGADVNWTQDLHERGPLGWATIFERVQDAVADYLISQGARYDIFSAITRNRADIVQGLADADPGVVNARMSEFENRQSAIVFAMSKRRRDMADLLITLGAEVGLLEAAALGRDERVRDLLSQSDPGALEPALRVAVQSDQVVVARTLLESSADAGAVDDGRNTLFAAIGAGQAEMARLLIAHGANLEFRDDRWKSTPLGWQVFFGNFETTRLALDLGAKVNPQLIGLAESGERGELRNWSYGTPESFRRIGEMLREAANQAASTN